MGRGRCASGDDYVVRMPGPWDGPVTVVAAEARCFPPGDPARPSRGRSDRVPCPRRPPLLWFEIESWARSGDRLSDLLYTKIGDLQGGPAAHVGLGTAERRRPRRRQDGRGHRDHHPAAGARGAARRWTTRAAGSTPATPGPSARSAARGRQLRAPRNGSARGRCGLAHRRQARVPAPRDARASPPGGELEVARRIMDDYQLADPGIVTGSTYDPDDRWPAGTCC